MVLTFTMFDKKFQDLKIFVKDDLMDKTVSLMVVNIGVGIIVDQLFKDIKTFL